NNVTSAWQTAHRDALANVQPGDKPDTLIHALAEDLLARFADQPLLDRYAIYQCLMDYRADTLADDLHLIVADGWDAAARPRGIIKDKQRKIEETPDLVIGSGKNARKYKMDLLPPALIVARYFAGQQADVDAK